jgi:hypothetical protein
MYKFYVHGIVQTFRMTFRAPEQPRHRKFHLLIDFLPNSSFLHVHATITTIGLFELRVTIKK